MPKLSTAREAVSSIKGGMTVMCGGFLNNGAPVTLLRELTRAGTKDLRVIANDMGTPSEDGVGLLIGAHLVREFITSHIGKNPEAGRQMSSGETPAELVPQGTLAERIRCGGCGLGGVLTPTGVGTSVSEGKREISIGGRTYLLETALRADVALIRAWRADMSGNLVFRRTERNFNPLMAMAADLVIVEVEEIVETGELDPDIIITPGILIDIIVPAEAGESA